jgi:hypothetical protein
MSIKVSNTKLNKLYEWILSPCFELLIQSFFHFVSCFYPEKLIIYVKNIIMEKIKWSSSEELAGRELVGQGEVSCCSSNL